MRRLLIFAIVLSMVVGSVPTSSMEVYAAQQESSSEATDEMEESGMDLVEEMTEAETEAETEGEISEEEVESQITEIVEETTERAEDSMEESSWEMQTEEEDTVESEELDAASATSGSLTDSITWKLSTTGTLTISGTGKMPDTAYCAEMGVEDHQLPIDRRYIPWVDSQDDIKKVIVSEGITSIGAGAFAECVNLESVSLPSTLTRISYAAFFYCPKLSEITIPKSVSVIKAYAFYGNSSLKELTIPSKVTKIENWTYAFCTNLEKCTMKGKIVSIGKRAFNKCESLKGCITLPSTVTTVDDYAFAYTDIERMEFGPALTKIGTDIFEWNWSINYLLFTGDAPTIDSNAFDGKTLKAFYPPNNATWTKTKRSNYGGTITWMKSSSESLVASGTWGTNLTWSLDWKGKLTISGVGEMYRSSESSVPWAKYGDMTEEIVVEEGVTSLCKRAFGGTCAKSIQIPDTVVTIGDGAFADANYIKSIVIPDSVTYLGERCFEYMWDLESVTIGAGVSELDIRQFDDTGLLKEFVVSPQNSEYASIDGVLYSKDQKQLLRAPHRAANVTIPETVEVIADGAFYQCLDLTSIDIPKSVNDLSYDAFTDTRNLESITVSESNPYYASWDGVLYNKKYTTVISVPRAKREMNSWPSAVTTIGPFAFESCKKLVEISLPDTITAIRGRAFYKCGYLSSLTLSKSLKTIGDNAFNGCSSLFKVDVPATVTSIGLHAFYEATHLDILVLHGGNTKLAGPIFNSYKHEIYYPEEYTSYSAWTKTKTGGSGLKMIPTSDAEKGIREQHKLVASRIAKKGTYAMNTANDSAFFDDDGDTIKAKYCPTLGGFYLRNGNVLKFFDMSDGSLVTAFVFPSNHHYYMTDDALYFIESQSEILYIFDLETCSLRKRVFLGKKPNGIDAVGVDSSGRIYIAEWVDNTTEAKCISVYSPDGTWLDSIRTKENILAFDGFTKSGHFFYEETAKVPLSTAKGRVLQEGAFIDGKLQFINHQTMIQIFVVDGLVHLEQVLKNDRYTRAEIIGGKYLVAKSTSNGLERVCYSTSSMTQRWETSKKIEGNSMGTGILYLPQYDTSLLSAEGKLEWIKATDTNSVYKTYTPKHSVYSMMNNGNQVILMEKEGEDWYLETMDMSAPTTITLSANASMEVGTTQKCICNTAVTGWTSSDKSILTVGNDGRICAWRAGTATITAKTLDGRTKTKTITVTESDAVPCTSKKTVTAKTGVTMTKSNNRSKNDYTVWSSVMNSYLYENSDGTLTRVEYVEGKGVIIENLDASKKVISSKVIQMELPIWGGFFCGRSYNYLVFGQTNKTESNTREVIRVVKYTKKWTRKCSLSIKGKNTYLPFDAGSVRMTEKSGRLYLHTSHEMYMDKDDGLRHQANMTFIINEPDMTLLNSATSIEGNSTGYVSHSFNQFVRVDSKNLYRLDHGDAYPRGVFWSAASLDNCRSLTRAKTAYPIKGAWGQNVTGVSVGGFELSSDNVLFVGNSVSMKDADTYNECGKRNVFLQVSRKNGEQEKTIWLTSYSAASSVTVRTPQLVKLASEHYLVMWEEVIGSRVRTKFALVDSAGNVSQKEMTYGCRLSDCQPILTSTGLVTWYVTDGTSVILYSVDPYHLKETLPISLSQPVLSSVAVVSSGVKVKWSAVQGAASYRIYRKVSGGSWKSIGTTKSTYYIDKTAENGKKYSYSVCCLDAAGEKVSTYSSTGLTISLPAK